MALVGGSPSGKAPGFGPGMRGFESLTPSQPFFMALPENYRELGGKNWEEVAAAWRQREAGIWDEHIRRNGYKDWDDFRFGPNGTLSKYGFDPLLEGLQWKQYEVLKPSETVPQVLVGPFKAWAIHNPKRNEDGSGVREALSFQTILDFGEILKNDRVRGIVNHLETAQDPLEPRLAIVLFAPDGRVLALDGLHTLSSYAVASHEGKKLKGPLHVHGAELSIDQMDYFERLVKGHIPMK